MNDLPQFSYDAIKFKFVIITATYVGVEAYIQSLYNPIRKINMPSLHIVGKTDKLVDYEKSLEFANLHFNEPDVFLHEQGHFIPNNTDSKSAYLNFITKMIEKIKN